jgi:hypothetical protein
MRLDAVRLLAGTSCARIMVVTWAVDKVGLAMPGVARRGSLRPRIVPGGAFFVLATMALLADSAWHTPVLVGMATCWYIATVSVASGVVTRRRRPGCQV